MFPKLLAGLLLLAAVATVGAQVVADAPRVKITSTCANASTCPLTLSASLNVTLTFTLVQPIICTANETDCSVTVLLTNTVPSAVSVTPCLVKWTSADWYTKRTVRVLAVQNFNLAGTTVTNVSIITEPAISPATFYNGTNPYDLLIVAQNRPSAQCRSTGDPHYTVFDGGYWNFYDGAGKDGVVRPRTVVNLVKTTTPGRLYGDLVIQTQVRGYPATNCAMAGREGNNLIILDVCSGKLVITTRFGSASSIPKVEVTGSTYTVYFRSGFWMRAVVSSSYMDVYVQAPGLDFDGLCGMCGNFNGNKNDDYISTAVTLYSQLTACQKVDLNTEDLWRWQPSAAPPPPPPAPGTARCPYNSPTYVAPILNNANGTDITQALIDAAVNTLAGKDVIVTNNTAPGASTTAPPPAIPVTTAHDACAAAYDNSAVVVACLREFGADFFNRTEKIEECTLDVQALRSLAATNDMITGMIVECSNEAALQDKVNSTTLGNVLCLNGCSGHGTCRNSVCTCDAGFFEADCSHDSNVPPTITGQYDTLCDVAGLLGCPVELAVVGTNFFQGPNLRCIVAGKVMAAAFLGSGLVVCALPSADYINTTLPAVKVSVYVTNDYTVPAQRSSNFVEFTYFQSTCQVCNPLTQACEANLDSCVVEGACYADGAASPSNPCFACDASASRSSFSPSLLNAAQCSPVFPVKTYDHVIQCTAAPGPLFTVAAGNAFLTSAQSPLQYSIRASSNQGVVESLFAIDAASGVISARVLINYTSLTGGMEYAAGNPNTYNGFFLVRATDAAGNIAEANVVIELSGHLEAGVCVADAAAPWYTAAVPENLALNAVVASAAPVGASGLTYGMWFEDNAPGQFYVDPASGVLTLLKKLDYETRTQYKLQVVVTNLAGRYYFASVVVNVTNVDEAPASIVLTPAAVDEAQPINTVIGVLSAVDPEGDAYDFTVAPNANAHLNPANPTQLLTSVEYDLDLPGAPLTFTVQVTVTERKDATKSTTSQVTVTINPVNEAPENLRLLELGSNAAVTRVSEGLPVGTPIGRVLAEDPENDHFECGVVSSLDDSFYVNPDTKQLTLGKQLNFEVSPVAVVVLACMDVHGARSQDLVVTLNVTDAAEAPTATLEQTAVVVENTVPVGAIATLTLTDDDAVALADVGLTPSLQGDSATLFRLGSVTCQQQAPAGQVCTAPVYVKTALNYEAPAVHGQQPLTVRVTDKTSLFNVLSFVINVADANDAPSGVTFQPTNDVTVHDGPAAGSVVTVLHVNDEDESDTHTCVLLNSTVPGAFAFTDDDKSLRVDDSAKINHNSATSITVAFKCTDSRGAEGTFRRTIAVTASPTTLTAVVPAASLAETLAVGTSVATVTLRNNQVAGSVDFYLNSQATGNTNAYFTLTASSDTTAVLRLAKALDFETLATLKVQPAVKLHDTQLVFADVLTFTVTNVDEAPVFNTGVTSLPALLSLYSHEATSKVLATAVARDPEGSAVTYSLNSSAPRFLTINPATGVISLAENGPKTFNYPKPFVFDVLATDATSHVGKFTITLQLKEACAASPCLHPRSTGVCRNCKFEHEDGEDSDMEDFTRYSSFGVTTCTDNREKLQGFACGLCAPGYTGSRCDINFNAYLVTVQASTNARDTQSLRRGITVYKPVLTTAQYNDVVRTYFELVGLRAAPHSYTSYQQAGINVTFARLPGALASDYYYLTFTRYSPYGPTPAELAGIQGFDFDYSYSPSRGPASRGRATLTAAQSAYTSVAGPEETTSAGLSSGSLTGLLVGLAVAALVVIIVAMAVRRRNKPVAFDKEAEDDFTFNATAYNPAFAPSTTSAGSVAPSATPQYSWYQPDMTRKDCTEYLLAQGDGAFVVRDSAATPGWHMLAVKTNAGVVHEKIRFTEDGLYELLPNDGDGAAQPRFADLPALVEYYLTSPTEEVPYTLARPNPENDYALASATLRRDEGKPVPAGHGYLYIEPAGN